MSAALVMRGVTRRYGPVHTPPALDDVSFEVAPGELVGLLGPNGAGKSTLLLCAAGLLPVHAGDVRRGVARVGWVPERGAFHPFLTVRETVAHYAALGGARGEARRVDEALERTALTSQADKRISALSRGMGQRLGLAQALAGAPRLLLLDETLSGLDPVTRRDIRELLQTLHREGVAIVLSSHDMAVLQQLAGRVVVMAAGRVRAEIDPARVSGARALELQLARDAAVDRRLAALLPAATWRGDRVRVPLRDTTAERVLAVCAAAGVVVHDSRLLVDDLEQRFFDLVEEDA